MRSKNIKNDPYRRRVYKAEEAAWLRLEPLSPDYRRGGSWWWMRRDIRAVFRDPKVVQRYPSALTLSRKTQLYDGRGDSWGGASSGRTAGGGYFIRMRRKARSNTTIIHEVAHVLTHCTGHGPRYARCMLFLTRRFLGIEAWRALKDEYRKKRVRTTKLKRRPSY